MSDCPLVGSLPGVFEEQSTKVATTAYAKGGRRGRDGIREVMRARVRKLSKPLKRFGLFFWVGWDVIGGL